MFLKSMGMLAPIVFGGLYVSGALGGGAYQRDVARTPAEVMAALQDLDIRDQPGSPGTDPSQSGGVAPIFKTEQTNDAVIFQVMSGDKVATRMIAWLQPLDGGKATRVTAEVERGDAPDDLVSPAFRSEGVTMGLFGMALEDELNELAKPAPNPTACREIMMKFAMGGLAAEHGRDADSLGEAVGGTAKTVLKLAAVKAEMHRNGCELEPGGGLGSVMDEFDRLKEGRSVSRGAQAQGEGESGRLGRPHAEYIAGSGR